MIEIVLVITLDTDKKNLKIMYHFMCFVSLNPTINPEVNVTVTVFL